MKEIDLNIPFKGTRDYLKGEDKYEAIVSFLKSTYPELYDGKLKMVFRRFTNQQCRLICPKLQNSVKPPENFVDEFVYSFKDKQVVGWIVEIDKQVTDRIPYPEELIFEKCSIKDRKISLSEIKSGFTSMEILVAMTKKLHLALYPSREKKWIVTQIELERFLKPDDADKLKIEFRENFKNRLTKSAIFSSEEMLGEIYFSLV